jgi:hypothetical protein
METKPKLLILTGPQGSGNHLFAKIFSSHKSVCGWNMKHDEWQGHHDEPFSVYWRRPELLKRKKRIKKYYVTSISCPYFYNKKPTIPNYKKFIKYASKIFDIQICIIGRDKNILIEQQKRVRSNHTTPIAIKNFKHLLEYNPLFISQELFCLYGIDYCNSISKLLNFPIDTKKVKALLKYNSNYPYIMEGAIGPGEFDEEAHRTSYIES